MDKNTVYVTIGSVLGIFAFLFAAYYFTTPKEITYSAETQKVLSTVQKGDHVKWATDSANLLVEYSDFQCPACKTFHDYFSSLEASPTGTLDLPKSTKLVFRNFPLSIHPNAEIGAYAAEAAGLQGKFFEMADMLYTNQKEWSDDKEPKKILTQYAKDLKLDVAKFTKDMDSDAVKNKVSADRQTATDAQIDGTPAFFLNGKKISGFNSFEEFNTMIEKGITGQNK